MIFTSKQFWRIIKAQEQEGKMEDKTIEAVLLVALAIATIYSVSDTLINHI